MPASLSQRMAGLPRWAWLLILASGLLIGLFLRQRAQASADAAGTDTSQQDPTTGDTSAASDGGYQYADPGLNAVPAGGAGVDIPVQTPMLPEGYADSFTTLATGLVDIATSASADHAATQQTAIENPPTSGTTPPTGGGPPPTPPPKMPGVTRQRNEPKYKIVKTRKTGKKGHQKTEYFWNGHWHTEKPPTITQYYWGGKWHDHRPHLIGTGTGRHWA